MQIPESHRRCPVGHATALLGDRWSLLIVREALRGVDRYQDFRHELKISDNTLTRRLTHLQAINVLHRNDDAPARYQLTDAGKDLARVLAVLADWGMQWTSVESPMHTPPEPILAAAEAMRLPRRQ